MKRQIPLLLAASALFLGGRQPLQAQPWFWRTRLHFDGRRDAETCSDLNARAEGELAKATEKFTLSKRQAPALEVRAGSHSSMHIRGWNRSDYEVEVCKFAAAGSRSEAERLLRSIDVRRDGARVSASGPDDDRDWHAVFLVHAPQDAVLNLESGNAPVAATRVNGKLTVHGTNGPVSLDECSGTIDVETTNGPISFTGGSGDVHLRAVNGPISLKLTDETWHGPVLEARTNNGPVNATVPRGFHSDLRLESTGHAPIFCQPDVCRNARAEGKRFFPRVVQSGSGDVVRLSTHNGPLSVNTGRRRARII